MQSQLIAFIVAFVLLSTCFINFYHPQLQYDLPTAAGGGHGVRGGAGVGAGGRGDMGASGGGGTVPHGIHSMTTAKKYSTPAQHFPRNTPLNPPNEGNSNAGLPGTQLVSQKQNEQNNHEEVKFHVTGEEIVEYDDSQYQAYLQKSTNSFRNHLGHSLIKSGVSLEDYMLELSKQPACATRPIFMSMARVSSDLYWHLIENFFYTMYYFDNLVREKNSIMCIHHP